MPFQFFAIQLTFLVSFCILIRIMSIINKQIGVRLRAARRYAEYSSAKAFAKKHSIAESTYSQHETGKRALNAEALAHYSELLNINPGWLLTGQGQPSTATGESVNSVQALLLMQESTLPRLGPIRESVSVVDTNLSMDV